ncbi:MAG: hypothetical protein WA705_14605 [Candidatus Ozemobacteraceae bacterium]
MKRLLKKQSPVWLQALKKQNIDPSRLSLNVLRAFRDFELFLNEKIPGPPKWQYLVRGFSLFIIKVFKFDLDHCYTFFAGRNPKNRKKWFSDSEDWDQVEESGVTPKQYIFSDCE